MIYLKEYVYLFSLCFILGSFCLLLFWPLVFLLRVEYVVNAELYKLSIRFRFVLGMETILRNSLFINMITALAGISEDLIDSSYSLIKSFTPGNCELMKIQY